MRERAVSIYTDSSLQTVTAGTLTGVDTGYFGGQVKTFGYSTSQESTCEAATTEYKYPQFYADLAASSVSSEGLAYVQSIKASDSCLPFDETYGSWARVDSWAEAGSLTEFSSSSY